MTPVEPVEGQEVLPRWHRKTFSRLGLGLFVEMVAAVIFQIAAILVWNLVAEMGAFPGAGTPGEFLFWFTEFSLPSILGTLVFYGMVRRVPARMPEEKRPLPPMAFLRAYLISGMALFLLNYLTAMLTNLIGALRGAPVVNPTESILDMPLYVVVLATCIVAPIVEETVFRRLLLSRLRPYGDRFAIIASALCFGLMHGNLSQFFYAFALGIVLGCVFARTGCVWQTILLHCLINTVGGVLPSLVESAQKDVWNVAYLGLILLFIVLGAVSLGYVLRRRAMLPADPGLYDLGPGELWRLFLLNVGVILFFVLCVLEAVLILMQ